MNAAILAWLVGLFGIGLGFAAGVATLRYGPTLAGGARAVAVHAVLLGSFAVGVALARAFGEGSGPSRSSASSSPQ